MKVSQNIFLNNKMITIYRQKNLPTPKIKSDKRQNLKYA